MKGGSGASKKMEREEKQEREKERRGNMIFFP
jgi:hypothetical protein